MSTNIAHISRSVAKHKTPPQSISNLTIVLPPLVLVWGNGLIRTDVMLPVSSLPTSLLTGWTRAIRLAHRLALRCQPAVNCCAGTPGLVRLAVLLGFQTTLTDCRRVCYQVGSLRSLRRVSHQMMHDARCCGLAGLWKCGQPVGGCVSWSVLLWHFGAGWLSLHPSYRHSIPQKAMFVKCFGYQFVKLVGQCVM
jgi:hypothetical protein